MNCTKSIFATEILKSAFKRTLISIHFDLIIDVSWKKIYAKKLYVNKPLSEC